MISGAYTKPSPYRAPTHKPSQSIPTRKSSLFRYTQKNNSTSINTLKRRNIRPAHQIQVNFDRRTKTSQLWSPHLIQVNFDPAHKNQVQIRSLHWNRGIFFTGSSIKLLSMPRHKNVLYSGQALKISNFYRHTNTKSILISSLKGRFWSPTHWNQVKVIPHTWTHSVLIPTPKTIHYRWTPTQTPSWFRSRL